MPPERPNRKRIPPRPPQPPFQVNPQASTSQTAASPRDTSMLQRKKRNTLPEQPSGQKPRPSVFDRLGTKNTGNSPAERQIGTKKEKVDHVFSGEARKPVRRISEDTRISRPVEREERTLDIDRKPAVAQEKSQTDNKSEASKESQRIQKHEDIPKEVPQEPPIESVDNSDNTTGLQNENKEKKEEEIEARKHREQDKESKRVPELQSKKSEDFVISGINSSEVPLKRRKQSNDDSKESIASYDDSEPAKEDVVSIIADDDENSTIDEYDDGEQGEIPNDILNDRGKKTNESALPIRSELSSDEGRNLDRERHNDNERMTRPNPGSPGYQSTIEDRRARNLEREREREERYNRAMAIERPPPFPFERNVERDREWRERGRPARYNNKNFLENKAYFDAQRKNERDKIPRNRERIEMDKGNSGSESLSSNTVRAGEASRSSSVSARERAINPNEQNHEKTQKETPLKDREKVREFNAKEREARHREDLMRDRERDARSREESIRERGMKLRDEGHPRTTGVPDLYRPSTDIHLRDPERRPIRDFEREFRDRELRNDMIASDRYHTEFGREREQIRDFLPETFSDRHPRPNEQRPPWDLDRDIRDSDFRGPAIFSDKDFTDHRREKANDDRRLSPSAVSEKIISHRQPSDRYPRDSEKQSTREDSSPKVGKTESNSREAIDLDKNTQSKDESDRDPQDGQTVDNRSKDDKNIDYQNKEAKIVQSFQDEIELPYPWKKCLSSKKKVYYFNTITRESRWTFPNVIDKNDTTRNKPSIDNNRASPSSSKIDIRNIRKAERDDESETPPHKKIRLDDHDSKESPNIDNRQISIRDTDQHIRENITPTTPTSNLPSKRETKEQRPINDWQSETPPRRTRGNTESSIGPHTPSSPLSHKSQASPTQITQFSTHNRSSSSGFNDRRFSSDYDVPIGIRRLSYGSSLGPPVSLRPSPSFNRGGGSTEIYDRSNDYRNEDYSPSNRSISNNNASANSSPAPSQQSSNNNRNSRQGSRGYISPPHFRSRSIHEIDSRVRHLKDGEDMVSIAEIDESTVYTPSRKPSEIVLTFHNDVTDSKVKSDVSNDEKINSRQDIHDNIMQESRLQTNMQDLLLDSDDDNWQAYNEINQYEEQNPTNFLLRGYNYKSLEPVKKDRSVNNIVAAVWDSISPETAGSIFNSLEAIAMKAQSKENEEKKTHINGRFDYERHRALEGGETYFRHKQQWATPRHIPAVHNDLYDKVVPEISDDLLKSCVYIFKYGNNEAENAFAAEGGPNLAQDRREMVVQLSEGDDETQT
ncbi:11121_t:CDS:2 [Ambispora leptoticha]|uniref:11121_t:CDS:1 n=1 Tax=Ambispora leptoticha TaxID=144679 RepID=A0A9N8YSU6_9GLOM|nr:11121_t:CDS:2 [Ambispora leptoticha]